MTIDIATIDNIPELNKLVNSAYRGDSSRHGWTTEADLLGGIRTNEELLIKEFLQPGASILKYVDDGQIQGCVYLRKNDQRLYLGMFTVSPYQQNKGIGKLLLRAAEEHAIKVKCKSIYMTVISVRHELISWYERHDYVQTGEIVPFPMDNPDFGLPKQQLEMIVLEKIVDN